MIFSLPVHYSIYGVKTGNTVSRDYQFAELVEFDIPVISPDDAPIAVSWSTSLQVALNAEDGDSDVALFGYRPDDNEMHTRFFDDGHWVCCLEQHCKPGDSRFDDWPADRPDEPAIAPKLSDTGLSFLLDNNLRNPVSNHPTMGKDAFAKMRKTQNNPEDLFALITLSTRASRIAEIEALVGQHVIIDGQVYRRCSEPKLNLLTAYIRSRRGSTTEVKLIKIETDSDTNEEFERLRLSHSIGDFDAALSSADRLSGRSSAARHENSERMPTIHLPHTIDEGYRLMVGINNAVNDYLIEMGQVYGARMPAEVAVTYGSMRMFASEPDSRKRFARVDEVFARTVAVHREHGAEWVDFARPLEDALDKIERRPIEMPIPLF
jgi:hypothetical protein